MALGDPILQVKTNAQLEAEESAEEASAKPAKSPDEGMKALAVHVKNSFARAEMFRQREITTRILNCRRQREGKYTAEKRAAIEKIGGVNTFFNITDGKCSAAQSWIEKVFRPQGTKPWAIKPTPLPDLPEDRRQVIAVKVVAEAEQRREIGEELLPDDITELAMRMYDEELEKDRLEANKKADRMSDLMEDQLIDGGFSEALPEFFYDLCTYPLAIMKGPIILSVRRLKWIDGKAEVVTESIPHWKRVDPFDFFPSPNMKDINKGYICEVVHISESELVGMKGAKGYNADEIQKAVDEGQHTIGIESISGETDRADLEDRDTTSTDGEEEGDLRGIEFWGPVQGSVLKEWGLDRDKDNPLDGDSFYEVNAVLVGRHIVRAVLNADPLGRRPYYATSYEKRGGTIWGDSIPEKMREAQDSYNACLRNAISNVATSSGVQVAVDVDSLAPETNPTEIFPGKTWQFHSSKFHGTSGRKPIEFFQVKNNSAELLRFAEFFELRADDRSQIPKFIHGSENITGAGETASGLSMLMNAASKGIERVIANIDNDMLKPLLERLYTWDVFFFDNEEFKALKGDVRIVATGALDSVIKEAVILRQQEWLNSTANPVDMQIIGFEGRRSVLEKVAANLNMDAAAIVPTAEILQRRLQEQQQEVVEEGASDGQQSAA